LLESLLIQEEWKLYSSDRRVCQRSGVYCERREYRCDQEKEEHSVDQFHQGVIARPRHGGGVEEFLLE